MNKLQQNDKLSRRASILVGTIALGIVGGGYMNYKRNECESLRIMAEKREEANKREIEQLTERYNDLLSNAQRIAQFSMEQSGYLMNSVDMPDKAKIAFIACMKGYEICSQNTIKPEPEVKVSCTTQFIDCMQSFLGKKK